MNWTQARSMLAEGYAMTRGPWQRPAMVVSVAVLGERFDPRVALTGEPLDYVLCLSASRTHWLPHSTDLGARDWLTVGRPT